MTPLLQTLTIPDPWQHEAARMLLAGKDVVVQAPTGAGKTYIFELIHEKLRGQAVFTVPTRALANDKLAEWQARGWDVGIATGDIAYKLDAKVVVATLETQKGRFLERRGPQLLVIDEYQMIGDPLRGVSYELAIALAPPGTQLLLLSGSVGNPDDIVGWLRRIGRDAELISHTERPVPLEEIELQRLPDVAKNVTGWWPRMLANALRADLGPILLFAPRRKAAESLALQLAGALGTQRGLSLTHEQEQLAGTQLARLLKARVAFHHSGLSYAQRAGLIEPLAKAGELRVVVATMGLAAGINFSMRSVAISGTKIVAGNFEREMQPDELLQMFGRAGRRGLDDTGYALITPQPPRLHDARPKRLRRANPVDWPTLVAVMHAAALREEPPFAAAFEVSKRLFSPMPIALGVEHSIETGPMPCGLLVDIERARFARRGVVEMLAPSGEWEPKPAAKETRNLGDAMLRVGERWLPALSIASTLDGRGFGNLIRLPSPDGTREYGREIVLGTRREGGLALTPSLKKLLHIGLVRSDEIESQLLAKLPPFLGDGRIAGIFPRGEQLIAHVAFDDVPVDAFPDAQGHALIDPPERRDLPIPCRSGGPDGRPCSQLAWCLEVPIHASPAHAWRRLGLIEPDGTPTRRGVIFSYFQHGEGLAVAASIEEDSYPIEDLVWDLANLRGGSRFAEEDALASGRLAIACQRRYGHEEIEGYLMAGVPIDYGAGASEALRSMVELGIPKQKLISETLRSGDIERALLEWRSLLRQIKHAPGGPADLAITPPGCSHVPLGRVEKDADLEQRQWQRWHDLRKSARLLLDKTEPIAPLGRK